MEKPSAEHDGEGADERHRHGGERDDGGAPGLQEEDDHDAPPAAIASSKRMHHGLDGMAHEDGGVIDHGVIHAVREILLQLFHRAADIGGQLQGVGAGCLEDRQGDGGFVVEQASAGRSCRR